jgi:predicted MPP superfamily phosphohydrolase
MSSALARAAKLSAGALAAGAGLLAYGGLIERNAFTLRRLTVPVLDSGSPSIRLLHLADLHITAAQRRKQAFVRGLARLSPDFVINTGDTLSDARAVPAVMAALAPLLHLPGGFVPGNNDYYAPVPKNPLRYFAPQGKRVHGAKLPWPEMARAMSSGGWLDLTHAKAVLDVAGVRVAVAGTDDPHLNRARYERIAGAAEPDAAVRIGVTHSPEPALLDRFAADGYDLVLAGHTHGGQVRVPLGPAIVTNCGIDRWRARGLSSWPGGLGPFREVLSRDMALHVSAGLGTSPYSPVRFACRPEATLLTLVPCDAAV